ncbi:uncharacterized protein C1orf105 homolog isoform X10 [Acinonyx jubatus]|uniref:Uncharacterized protein C1orf105 homolog isoform X10 n=1 Tax=Acinonyx jubatus TaxID=32536 RepID=A0ABM3NZQ4_ACIJB|nr:uncharacterized protein C1orf105 homolog isoform X10 [Acinonyx jubatus]XP_053064913.1 uncharacterized protein C1orf105 homolog isoform X10 [Acinonyx jubatus]XP_053064914.1 uncharacterized protein C1orf105 homolog isoform X10 [Acinonyx jubatus]
MPWSVCLEQFSLKRDRKETEAQRLKDPGRGRQTAKQKQRHPLVTPPGAVGSQAYSSSWTTEAERSLLRAPRKAEQTDRAIWGLQLGSPWDPLAYLLGWVSPSSSSWLPMEQKMPPQSLLAYPPTPCLLSLIWVCCSSLMSPSPDKSSISFAFSGSVTKSPR